MRDDEDLYPSYDEPPWREPLGELPKREAFKLPETLLWSENLEAMRAAGDLASFSLPERCPECGRRIERIGSGHGETDRQRVWVPAHPCGCMVEMERQH